VDPDPDRARDDLKSSPSRADDDLYVVVPVRNEAQNFPRFYESLTRHVTMPFRLVIVYDAEDDTTLPVARALAEQDSRILFVRNEAGGILNALRCGLAYPPSGAVIVSMADLSDDHAKIDEMVSLYRSGCDVVAASRYSKGGRQIGGPLLKRVLSQVAGLSLHFLAGLPTRDPTNNFKLYSSRLLHSVTLESTKGFEVALELTVKAHLAGMRIGEVPATWRDRVAGRSSFRLFAWLPGYLRWYAQAFRHRRGK
jgi:dolichol-phosphate mannosyltransferase